MLNSKKSADQEALKSTLKNVLDLSFASKYFADFVKLKKSSPKWFLEFEVTCLMKDISEKKVCVFFERVNSAHNKGID